MSKVSVIIPTYNRRAFLAEAIDSVLKQSFSDFELIVVDDGSTDDTVEYLKTLHDDRLRVIQKENQGPSAARNLGITQAKGEWIALLDSDDLWEPKRLEVQMEFIEEKPDYLWLQCEEKWIRNGVRVNAHKKHQKHSGYIFQACLPLCIVSPSAVIFKKEFFETVGGFDESLIVCEDYDLWLRMALFSRFKTLPEAYCVKRGGHEDQLSHQHWGMDRFRVQAMEKILSKYREHLKSEDELALLKELEKKTRILKTGFAKRNPEQKNLWEEKWQKYQKKLHDLTEEKLQKSVL